MWRPRTALAHDVAPFMVFAMLLLTYAIWTIARVRSVIIDNAHAELVVKHQELSRAHAHDHAVDDGELSRWDGERGVAGRDRHDIHDRAPVTPRDRACGMME